VIMKIISCNSLPRETKPSRAASSLCQFFMPRVFSPGICLNISYNRNVWVSSVYEVQHNTRYKSELHFCA
jgi:hypothetical protein